MQMFKPTIFTQPWLTDVWPTLLRVFVGVLLVGHGGDKLFNGLDRFVAQIAEKGWPAPELQAFAAVFSEFAGGVLLIVGLFTRPAALMQIITFFIITFVWAYDGPFFMKQEKPLMFLVLNIYLFCVGPGKVSVDWFLFGKQAAKAEPLPTSSSITDSANTSS